MKTTILAVALSFLASHASAENAFNPEFVDELRSLGLEEQAFQYSLIWAGSGDPDAEFELALSLLDGRGTAENPMAAMHFACGSRAMRDFYVEKILIQGNMRLAGTGAEIFRCSIME